MMMNIQMDSYAKERLLRSLNGQVGHFKLIAEAEGCSIGGNYSILLVSEPGPTDVAIQSEAFSFLVDKQQAVTFEPTLRLKGRPTYPSYRLSSDSRLYSDHVILKDHRISAAI
jgi:uncharacterized protein YqkB